jgi:succinyl-CoA synthetase beta subunit
MAAPEAGAFETIGRLLAAARGGGRSTLTEPETKTILAAAGVPVPREHVAENARQAVVAARDVGFPVVLKVVSPDLPHKSEVGGVVLGLDSADAVRKAYHRLLDRVCERVPRAQIDGVLVQPQLRGLEVILGATTDAQFGPVMVFGLGGTAVEVLRDVAFRLAPLDEHEARAMLEDVRGAPLLNGFRGAPAVNKRSIVTALLRLSTLMWRFSDVIREIEVNPMLVTAEGAVAVDAMAVVWPTPLS